MPCPVSGHGGDPADERSGPSPGVDRRAFLKSALAIGGAAALSACVDRTAPLSLPVGPSESALSSLPDRQFAWNRYLVTDAHGNTALPHHQLLLFLDVTTENPTAAERRAVEGAFRTLERAFQRGTGGDTSANANDGLLFTVGYAPSYFDRFDESLPASVDLPTPEAVLEEIDEDPSKADPYDAMVLLTSDHVQALLSAEMALFGELDELNGVPVEGDLAGAFEKADRRTGFIGKQLPAERLDHPVPEESPAAMGFKSGFRDNQAGQDRVTIQEGPFAGGTTQHVSKLEFELGSWYERDHADRVELMFSPDHSRDDVGEVGDFLASDSKVTDEVIDSTERHARERGRVGHTQKVARAREDDSPLILRRSEGVSTDSGTPGLNFTSLQRGIADFVETRTQMNGADLPGDLGPDGDGDDVMRENGILDHISVRHRANFLVPPRELRALPPARP